MSTWTYEDDDGAFAKGGALIMKSDILKKGRLKLIKADIVALYNSQISHTDR